MSKIGKKARQFVKALFFPTVSTHPGHPPKRRQEWSIGIYVGESLFRFGASEKAENPVLTREHVSDVPAMFVADPFMLKVRDTWYMFFEVMDRRTRKGIIGLATSEDGLRWIYQQVVLAEPFHLSYPYVFEWKQNYYMIPESWSAGSVRLYKALRFPAQWLYVDTLISGPRFSDSSLVHYANKWWLFTETDPQMKFDTLRLYWADDLEGPWVEHPRSPIVEGNPHIARPAGRIVVLNDRVIRYAQDCYPTYGTQVHAFEITELTSTSYHEQEVGDGPVLTGSGTGWNRFGMHHIDPCLMDDGQWRACVDGWTWTDVNNFGQMSIIIVGNVAIWAMPKLMRWRYK